MAKDEKDETEQTPGEKAQARIDRGNRQALKTEAEDPAEREERIREGQVFEDLDPRQDDPRRRLKVLAPDDGGKVLLEDLRTRRRTHIDGERLLSDAFKRSV